VNGKDIGNLDVSYVEFRFKKNWEYVKELIELTENFKTRTFSSYGNYYYYMIISNSGDSLREIITKLTLHGFKTDVFIDNEHKAHNSLLPLNIYINISK
jgi:hypothetical protein